MITNIHNQSSLHTADKCPDGAVNLAYFSAIELSISENIQVSSMLDIIKPDSIRYDSSVDEITTTSELFMITNKMLIEDNIEHPLYYKYTLKYRTSSKDSISISYDMGRIPSKYKFKIEDIEILPGIYVINIYTNFSINSIVRMNVIYNPIINNEVVYNHKELVNPQVFMRPVDASPSSSEEYVVIKNDTTYNISVTTTDIYYILPLDGGSIYCNDPIAIGSAWYPRINNGIIKKSILNTEIPEEITYKTTDYYKQEFSDIGIPYVRVTEDAKIIGSSSIRTSNKNIYTMLNNDGTYKEISVSVNGVDVLVTSIDSRAGIIYINAIINVNDNVSVSYIYREDSYIYTGYTVRSSNNIDTFIPLDLNPSSGHKYGYIKDNGMVTIEDSFRLLNKTVYIYMKPSLIQAIPVAVNAETIEIPETSATRYIDNELRYVLYGKNVTMKVKTKYSEIAIPSRMSSIPPDTCSWELINDNIIRIWNINILSGEPVVIEYLSISEDLEYTTVLSNTSNCIFHTLEPIESFTGEYTGALLIAKIYVRPNSSIENIKLFDTRRRGGGLIECKEEEIDNINPEARYYLDIGDINGELLQENNVIIFNINIELLIENGGHISKDDINVAINKYKACGVMPIVRYIDPDTHYKIL